MTRKQKRLLVRILLAAALLLALHFVPVTGISRLFLYLIPYLVIGYDLLRKAALGILHGQVLDENFLMAAATLGALVIGVTHTGDYAEAVAVMLFFQIGRFPLPILSEVHILAYLFECNSISSDYFL